MTCWRSSETFWPAILCTACAGAFHLLGSVNLSKHHTSTKLPHLSQQVSCLLLKSLDFLLSSLSIVVYFLTLHLLQNCSVLGGVPYSCSYPSTVFHSSQTGHILHWTALASCDYFVSWIFHKELLVMVSTKVMTCHWFLKLHRPWSFELLVLLLVTWKE